MISNIASELFLPLRSLKIEAQRFIIMGSNISDEIVNYIAAFVVYVVYWIACIALFHYDDYYHHNDDVLGSQTLF